MGGGLPSKVGPQLFSGILAEAAEECDVRATHGTGDRALGVESVSPGLPSCGEGPRPAGLYGPGLTDDVHSVRRALLATTEPSVVVAHSYGGIVAAEAAAGLETVRHLLR